MEVIVTPHFKPSISTVRTCGPYTNGDVIVFTPGETVTVFARVDEGYYLNGWNIPGANVEDKNVYEDSVTFVVPDAAFTMFISRSGTYWPAVLIS